MKVGWKILFWFVTLVLSALSGAAVVWAIKPLNTPLFCAEKGMDAIRVAVLAIPWELMENWIIALGIILVCIPLYGLWISARRLLAR